MRSSFQALRCAALVGAALLAAGCGSAGGTGAPPPTTAPSVTTAAPSTATSATTDPATNDPASTTGAPAPSETPVPAESNPPGDIPDNLAFVAYRNAAGRYTFTHPEGWLRQESGTGVTFTDKLNGVRVTAGPGTPPAGAAAARSGEVPMLQRTVPAFELRGVSTAKEPAGTAVRIVYRRNSDPDPVTGRQYRDEVERYEFAAAGGRLVVMELFGPVGADNVDAYRTMVRSLRLS